MIRGLMFTSVALLASAAFAADSGQDAVKSAAKKLADAGSYSWKTTAENAGGGQAGRFGGGSSSGKTEKDGYTLLTFSGPNGDREVVIKGGKAAIRTDDGWKTAEELTSDNGGGGGQPNPGRFIARIVQNFKTPAEQVLTSSDEVKDCKRVDDVYSADFTEDGAKKMLAFGRRGGGGNGPQINSAKASIKIWLKDGVLSKYELHVEGSLTGRNGNEINIDRTTTTEITDVGSTKVDVPEDAKKKLS